MFPWAAIVATTVCGMVLRRCHICRQDQHTRVCSICEKQLCDRCTCGCKESGNG